jgi:transposase
VRSAMDWAQVRTLAADGHSQREIARRPGINRRTVRRLVEAEEPPRYRREAGGSMLDPLEPVIRRSVTEYPGIKAPRMTEILRGHGYEGSVDLVKRRLRELRPPAERPAQRTGYRPAQVMQFDWAETATRPRIAGRERRVYALLATLPHSAAQTAHFSFEMTVESFLEGHVHAFEWLGGVPRECVYDNLRSAVARREGDEVRWAGRSTHLRGHYAFHPTACTPATPREKGSVEGGVRYLKTGFWPLRRLGDLAELSAQSRSGETAWRIAASTRPVASRSRIAWRPSARPPARCRRGASISPTGVARGCRSTATWASAAATTGPRYRSSTSGSSCAPTATPSGSAITAPPSPATSAPTGRAPGCRSR